jgi:Mn2+/Fe2+ NRAMP family transporter
MAANADEIEEATIDIPDGKESSVKKFLAFAGPGVVACVAYLDPG